MDGCLLSQGRPIFNHIQPLPQQGSTPPVDPLVCRNTATYCLSWQVQGKWGEEPAQNAAQIPPCAIHTRVSGPLNSNQIITVQRRFLVAFTNNASNKKQKCWKLENKTRFAIIVHHTCVTGLRVGDTVLLNKMMLHNSDMEKNQSLQVSITRLFSDPCGENSQKVFFCFFFFFPALWSQKLLWCCRGGFHIAPHCAHTHSGAANNGARVIRAKHGRSRRYCAATNRHSQSKISGVCAFAVFGGGPTFAVMSRMLRFLLLLLLLLMLSLLLFFFFFLWEWRVNDSPLRVVRVEEGGERAIKSLPEQPGMTHTTEFIRKRGRWGEGNREREKERERERERGQRRASWHLKIISGNKPRKRLWWSLTH